MTELGWDGKLRRFLRQLTGSSHSPAQYRARKELMALVLWSLPRAAATPHIALDGVLKVLPITFLSLSPLQATILKWKKDLLARMDLLL